MLQDTFQVNVSSAFQQTNRNNGMKHRRFTDSSTDDAAVTDTPLCWLLLGLDAITAELAPPPPNWMAEFASMPSPPPNLPIPAVQSMKVRKARFVVKASSSASTPLPQEGTPEYTAARLLKCLRRVAQWQERVRSQRQLQTLVRETRGIELPMQKVKPVPYKQEVQKTARPCTPDVLEKLKERDTFWQPMHSQVWRRRELMPKQSKKTRSPSATSLMTLDRGSRSSSKVMPPRGSNPSTTSQISLPPVKDVVKKYDRGAPALGAGFKVLAGFRTEAGASQLRAVNSGSKLLTLDGAVDLLKDCGAWPARSLSAEHIGLPKSMGSLPPLREPVRDFASNTEAFPTKFPSGLLQDSTEFGQTSTYLEDASAELTTTLGPEELGYFDDCEVDDANRMSYQASCKSLQVPEINPLTVFPDLKHRAPMPAKRIFFTDPDCDDERVNAIRDPVDTQEIYAPPPAATPSSVTSLTEYSLLMASVMRGDLLSSSLRKPRETDAELKLTLELASTGLMEALDEPSSEDDRHVGQRHPPPWTRKRSVLNTSGVRDFADMGPNRQPHFEVDTTVAADAPQWAYMKSCAKEKILPKAHRPIVKAVAEKARRGKFEDDCGVLPPNSQETTATNDVPVCLNLADHSLGDSGLHALGQTMTMLGSIETLNLSGNKLSCKATSDFLRSRMDDFGKVLELDLSRNPLLGEDTFKAITELLQDGKFRRLHSINLSGIHIPEKMFSGLMKKLLENVVLKELSVADTKLGFKSQETFQALAPLLVQGALTSLDISGNFIRRDGADALARALEKTRTLRCLDLSHNAGDHLALPDKMLPPRLLKPRENSDNACNSEPDSSDELLLGDIPFSPLLTVLESLQWNISLQKISLANCSIDFAADFVIAEILLRHAALVEVDLSSNPHGLEGLSCLLRAISVPHSSLRVLNVSDLRNENVSRFACKYDFKDPCGKYTLNLLHPQHRSVLRTLLDRPRQNLGGKDSKACFQDASYEYGIGPFGGIGSIPQDSGTGIHKVPTDGVLRFSYGALMPTTPRGDTHPLAKVQDWHRRGLIHIGFERSLIVASAYCTCTSESQKLLFTDALSRQVLLKSSQLELLLQCAPKTLNLQTLQRLAPNVVDCSEMLELSHLLRNSGERLKARLDLRALAFLNMRNPTGHYCLDLANICDRACAGRLQVLAAFEAALQRSQGRPDISQRGNFEPVRNAQHIESRLSFKGGMERGVVEQVAHDFLTGENALTFAEVSLPFGGVLEVDYVTLSRPRNGLRLIAEDTLRKLLAALRHSKALVVDTLQAFRGVADRFGTTFADVREVLNTFAALSEIQDSKIRHSEKQASAKPPQAWIRVEVLLACFGCCSNRSEVVSKLCSETDLFTAEECSELRHRLGPVIVFDWEHCDEMPLNRPMWMHAKSFAMSYNDLHGYSLDLAMNDDRLVAKFLLRAAEQESWECLSKPSWTKAKLVDKPPEKLAEWVRTWLREFPEEGVFSINFLPAEDDVPRRSRRREIAQKLGFEV